MATVERGSAERPNSKRKVSIIVEAETRMFIQRYRQYMREHSKAWGLIERDYRAASKRYQKTGSKADSRAIDRVIGRLTRLGCDRDAIRNAFRILLENAKNIDRIHNG